MKDETKQTEIHAFIFQKSYRKSDAFEKIRKKSMVGVGGWGGGATSGSW